MHILHGKRRGRQRVKKMINTVQIQLNFEQSVKITNYEEKENKHLKKNEEKTTEETRRFRS